MGRIRDKLRAAATRRALATLKQDAIEFNGAIWDSKPEGRRLPYPFAWVEESGRGRVRALEQAHYRATEQGRDSLDVQYQWMATQPQPGSADAGVARIDVRVADTDGTEERISFWFPLPTFVAQLRFMATQGGVCVTSMDPAQIMDAPLWRGFSVAFTSSVAELHGICDSWDTTPERPAFSSK